jgi:hypothetical protein
MTDDMIELGRRAVACKGWRWMPGMLGWRPNNQGVPHSIRFVEGVESMGALAGVGTGRHIPSGYATCDGDWRSADITPDLTDPATLGCLLALVREVRKAPAGSVCCHHVTVCPDPDFDVWSWYDSELPRMVVMDGSSEAAALVAALEAAL